MPNVPCEICGGSGLVRCAQSLIPTYYECGCDALVCWHCEKPIVGIGVAVFEDSTDERAHKDCNEAAAERQHDRLVEDYYGSSSPQTERERYDAAAEQKRRLR